MNKTTHEIRIANWRSIIEQCQARPDGQSAKQWLADNGISEKTYYYWQRKVRQETYAPIKQDAVPFEILFSLPKLPSSFFPSYYSYKPVS